LVRSQSARPTLTAHRTCNGRSIIIWDTQILACRIQLAVSGVRAADCGDGMGGPQVATQTLGESEMPELKSQFKSFLGGTAASSAPPRLHGAQSQSPQISNNKSHNYGEAAVHCVPSRSHSLPSVRPALVFCLAAKRRRRSEGSRRRCNSDMKYFS